MPPDAPEYNTGCKRDTAFALRVQAGFCTVPPFFRSLFGSSLFSGPFWFCLFVVFVSFCFVLVSGFRFLSWPWSGVGGLAALSLLVLWGGLLPFRVLLCSLGPFVLGRGLGCLCWFLFLVLFVSWLFGSCFLVLFLVLVDSLYFFCVLLHSHLVSRLSKWTSGR